MCFSAEGSVAQGPTRELDKETLLSSMSSMLVCKAIGNAMSEMSVDNRQPTETSKTIVNNEKQIWSRRHFGFIWSCFMQLIHLSISFHDTDFALWFIQSIARLFSFLFFCYLHFIFCFRFSSFLVFSFLILQFNIYFYGLLKVNITILLLMFRLVFSIVNDFTFAEAELRRSRSSDSIILVNTNETDFCHVFDLSTRLVSRAIQNAIERYGKR